MDPQNQPPLRDLGSFVYSQVPSDADIKDHRSQETVYIGLHLPKHRHRHRHHRRHKRVNGDKTLSNNQDAKHEATPPAQRVQFLLGEEEDEEHRTHDLFCEMEELHYNGDQMEWKESARWIKFEEDVEEGGERWSKPHVATLSLHSLFELRCNILTGTVMLDIEPYDLPSAIDLLVDNLVASKQLEEELKDKVRDTVLIQHRHQNQKKHHREDKYSLPIIRSLADIGKKYSEPRGLHHHDGNDKNHINNKSDRLASAKTTPNFLNMINENHTPTPPQQHQHHHHTPNNKLLHHATYAGNLTSNHSSQDLLDKELSSHKDESHDKHGKGQSFMKKIPQGSEAANILVGEVEFLTHPIVGFLRLLRPIFMKDLTEVPIPSKFIFILLGPMKNQSRYHEIGRSMATLMSDEVFHDVAYHARNKEDLLAGIDEFLDQVTVLPPGEWDPSIRIEPPKSVPSQEARKNFQGTTPMPNGKVPDDDEEEGHGEDPGLQRTGRFFGGLRNDVKRKIPFYFTDFKDSLHIQCLASFIFLYFACLTPIVTFGGLLGDATEKNMAAFESLLAGAICGIVYALFAGQPLTILGSTGPVLVFETILYQFCSENSWNYLEFRWWIGLWTGVALIIMVAFDLSAWVRYITRFTEESFALLISLIFIKEAFHKLFHVADSHPIHFFPEIFYSQTCYDCVPPNHTRLLNSSEFENLTFVVPPLYNISVDSLWKNLSDHDCIRAGGHPLEVACTVPNTVPEVFFLSVIQFTGTFTIAVTLKALRNSRLFPNVVRQIVSDFAVLIAILSMVTLDVCLGIDTPKLEVPSEFRPTNESRSWLINPVGSNPWWLAPAAIFPALLATILIFMDQQITAVIVNRKENKLLKGHGYHLDLFIVSTLIIVCSFLGLPWYVAATVLSITHVTSLKKESECTAPGERPKFLGVREQRATGVAIFLLIGISVLMTKVLQVVPMPVLYGVFLYMGVISLKGMQVVNRILIWFMPQKYQPDYSYLRHVPTRKVHLFTFIQVLCLVILWVIKSIKVTSIAFPIMVLAMCFVRKGMDKIFTQRELKWLDDIMPESHKRAKEDLAKKKDEENQDEANSSFLSGSGTVQVPLSSGNIINIPVERITVSTDIDNINISEEMAKTACWKTLLQNESSVSLDSKEKDGTTKHRRKHKDKSRRCYDDSGLPTIPSSPREKSDISPHKKKSKKPIQFYIDEEEKEQLLYKPPEIVVDPPSGEVSIKEVNEEDTNL